ncbi:MULTISPECIES: hypothetical protein [Paenibacillus]|uniref:Uncharacterized protein n=1 Tax=Paenibacillus baimaensis TaxID=2982185 RepID=A0ABT2UEZ1_9BACL|nr:MULTISPECIES: hypothetical protein [unclassified Paenibacillus]MCU6793213.1 hypothetical protein [Paenibacillus sp. WQ 127069]OMF03606.1 hypothetical protein BK127_35245 [Paenibacillus sp. FSL H7-0331]
MSIKYSTGPLENTGNNRSVDTVTHVLNNNRNKTVTAKIKVFALDGTKTIIDEVTVKVPSRSNIFHTTTIPVNVITYEVQIKVHHEDDNTVLVGTFGRDAAFNQNPNHIVHREFTRIDV